MPPLRTNAQSPEPSQAPGADASFGPPMIADYELLKRIGRGSYGEVWLARTKTGSYRAVKIVHRDSFEAERPYEREFEGIREFETISRAHPSQVDILHVGRDDEEGYFFYVMELADDASCEGDPAPKRDTRKGRSRAATATGSSRGSSRSRAVDPERYTPKTLKELLARRERLPVEECTSLAVTLAEALEYLHGQGLMHRDVKPSNIVFIDGSPKLADIGLVAPADATLSLVGTEGYLPPEGAGTLQADLYALGKVVYEAATGRSRSEFPQLPPDIRAEEDRGFFELNEVIVKACETHPRDRYQSATEMLADLALLKRGRSLRTIRRMEKRLRILSRVGIAAAFAAVVAAGAFLLQRQRAQEAEEFAAREAELRQSADAALFRMERQRVEELFANGEDAVALARLARLVRGRPENEALAERLLSALMYRQFPLPVAEMPHGYMTEVSPDDNRVAIASDDGVLRLFDPEDGGLRGEHRIPDRVVALQFGPESLRAITASEDGRATVWRIAGTASRVADFRHGNEVSSAAFSPDGQFVLSASGPEAFLWEARSGALVLGPLKHERPLIAARFSPKGERFLTAIEGRIHVWESASGRPLQALDDEWLKHWNKHNRVVWGPSGTRIAYISFGGGPRIWHLASERVAKSSTGHTNTHFHVAFSPDGSRLATASYDRTARIWDTETGMQIGPPLQHKNAVWSVVFSPNGEVVATGSLDNTMRLWSAQTGAPLSSPIPHQHHVEWLRFSADGRRLLSRAHKGTHRTWDIGFGKARPRLFPHPPLHDGDECVTLARFDSQGKALLTAVADVVKTPYGQRGLRPLPAYRAQAQLTPLGAPSAPDLRMFHEDDVISADFSRDGSLIVTASRDGTAQVWRRENGQRVGPPLEHADEVRHAEISDDKRRVLTASADGAAAIWAIPSGKKLHALSHRAEVWHAAFDPDGRLAATASTDGSVAVWEVKRGEELHRIDLGNRAFFATFSPDGRWIVAGSERGARVYRAEDGVPVTPWLRHDYPVVQAQFSREGRRLLTASHDGTAKLWSAPSGRLLAQFNHGSFVWEARFGANDSRAATASRDRTARVWNTDNGLPLSEALRHDEEVLSVSLSPNGRWLASACFDGLARLWEIPVVDSPAPDWLPRLAEAVAGIRLSDTDNVEWSGWDGLSEVKELVASNGAPSNDCYYWRWARWFFADRRTRPISPSSSIGLKEYLHQRLAQNFARKPWALREALEIAPMNAEVLARLGRKLVVKWFPGESVPFDDALRFTRLAVERDPRSPVAWWGRAEVLTEAERYEEAEPALERALELDKTDPNARYVRALLHDRHGRPDAAYTAFLEAVSLAASSESEPFAPSLLNESLRGFEESEQWTADDWRRRAEFKSLRPTPRALMERKWIRRKASELAELSR